MRIMTLATIFFTFTLFLISCGPEEASYDAQGEIHYHPFNEANVWKISYSPDPYESTCHIRIRSYTEPTDPAAYRITLACPYRFAVVWHLPVFKDDIDSIPTDERLHHPANIWRNDPEVNELAEDFWDECYDPGKLDKAYFTRHVTKPDRVPLPKRGSIHGYFEFDAGCFNGSFEVKINYE